MRVVSPHPSIRSTFRWAFHSIVASNATSSLAAVSSSAAMSASRSLVRAVFFAGVLLGLTGCSNKPRSEGPPPTPPASTTLQLAPSAVATPPAAPTPENVLAATTLDANPPNAGSGSPEGAASPGCVNGWSTPERGSALRSAVLDMLRVRPGERFIVEDMRYFVGPEDAEVIGARGDVERWYVKASTDTEPRRRQRWLVRRAAIGSGVDAVAPFDSTGYGPATWRRPDASDESLADPFQRPCQGTQPGDKCMGLPREVLGCLSGT